MFGFGPLHYAAFSGEAHTVKELLKAGAVRDARSKRGFTPLDIAGPHDEVRQATATPLLLVF